MSAAAFHTLPHSSLASAGLGQGGVDVGYGAGGLALAGRDGARLDLPWTTIRKVRVGIEQSKYGPPRYRLTLWTSAAPQPLRLTSLHSDEAAFAGVARTVALRTFYARGKARWRADWAGPTRCSTRLPSPRSCRWPSSAW